MKNNEAILSAIETLGASAVNDIIAGMPHRESVIAKTYVTELLRQRSQRPPQKATAETCGVTTARVSAVADKLREYLGA